MPKAVWTRHSGPPESRLSTVPGDLDRVGAVNVLPDGRVVAAVWSRTYFDPYDCAHDRVALVRLAIDGSAAETLTALPSRDSFVNDGSCRTTLTMQVLHDQTIFYPYGYAILVGGELGIRAWLSWDDYEDIVDTNGRYGPFVLDLDSHLRAATSRSSVWQTRDPCSLAATPTQPTFPGPAWLSEVLPLGSIAGLQGGITAMQLATVLAITPGTSALPTTLARRVSPSSITMDRSTRPGAVETASCRSSAPGYVAHRDGVLNVNYGLATDVRLIAVRPGGNIVVATADGVIQRLIGQSADLTHGGLVLAAPERIGFRG